MPRLFVAVYPPVDVANMLACAAAELSRELGLSAFSTTSAEQLHLTVHFVGETGVAEMPRVVETVRRAAGGLSGFEVRTRGLAVFPRESGGGGSGGAARTIVVESSMAAPLAELRRRVAHRLARRPEREDRYSPHITLGRFGGAGREIDRGAVLARAWPSFAWRVDRVMVMESVLKPAGAVHRALTSIELGAGGEA